MEILYHEKHCCSNVFFFSDLSNKWVFKNTRLSKTFNLNRLQSMFCLRGVLISVKRYKIDFLKLSNTIPRVWNKQTRSKYRSILISFSSPHVQFRYKFYCSNDLSAIIPATGQVCCFLARKCVFFVNCFQQNQSL